MNKDTDINYIREKFEIGVRSMRAFENEIAIHSRYFEENEETVAECVAGIVEQIEKGRVDRSNE